MIIAQVGPTIGIKLLNSTSSRVHSFVHSVLKQTIINAILSSSKQFIFFICTQLSKNLSNITLDFL